MTGSSRAAAASLGPLASLATAVLLASCSSGPHPIPGVRFDGAQYRETFMAGLVVPASGRRSIGRIEATSGGIDVTEPTVFTVGDLDPGQVIFVAVPRPDAGGPGVDLFISTDLDDGSKPWPAELCQYLKPGWVEPGTPLPCATPASIRLGDTEFVDYGEPFRIDRTDLAEIGPFTTREGSLPPGFGALALRIRDVDPAVAVAVAAGPEADRIYVRSSDDGAAAAGPPSDGLRARLCPYRLVPDEACSDVSDEAAGS